MLHNIPVNYGPKIDYEACNGCKECYVHCPMDILGWDEEKSKPVVLYPAECSFCCYCEILCEQVAIDVAFPLHPMLDFGINVASMK
jgi:NAD-dependent dihydropyrimidine dehydrogenase PreA subunit